MASSVFVVLSLAVIFAVFISAIMRFLKQPLVIGYIITGIVVGPYFFGFFDSGEVVKTFSQIGVALLLFMVGLHLNPKVIKEVGKASLVTGVGQVLFTSIIGFLISTLLGFSIITSIYIAIAVSFSSTIIIMKLLSDKGDIDSLYGKISIGFLIVQDLIAIFALIIVSSLSAGGGSFNGVLITLVKGLVTILLVFGISYISLPFITRRIAKSQEFLFLFAIGWCLGLATLFYALDFSLEIGALIAGITLSMSPYNTEINSKMTPLRDFFLVLFFIIIGSQITFLDIGNNIIPIVAFSLFILIGNPLLVIFLMGRLGYAKRTGFLSGLTVAQISEFSIILVALGVSVGHLSTEILSLITTIGLITIAGSTYMIIYSNKIYSKISKFVGFAEKGDTLKDKKLSKEYDTILFGYNRIGFDVLRALKKIKGKYLIVDFNPDTIANLKKLKMPALYGDAYDSDLLSELSLDKVSLIVSTIPDSETNALLVDMVRAVNKKAIIIVKARQINDALDLYRRGANYVLTAHFLGGEHLSKMISKLKVDKGEYGKERRKHIKDLTDRLRSLHKNPFKYHKGEE